MKIENYQNYRVGNQVQRNYKLHKNPNFTSKATLAQDITNSLHHKGFFKWAKKMEWLKGEIGGILITALGTGLVAPIFIGYNPFVKAPKDATPEQKEETKNTKLYTAMRQPISAALAILFQASVQKYIDKGLDAVFNNSKFSKYARVDVDQQVLNTDTYIKDNIRKGLKGEKNPLTIERKTPIKKPSLLASWFGKKKRNADGDKVSLRDQYDNIVKERLDQIKEQQINKVAEAFQAEGKIKVGERYLDHKSLVGLISNQIDDYITDAEKLKYSPELTVKHVNRAKVLVTNEDHLREIFKQVPVDKVNAAKEGSKELKEAYKETTTVLEKLLKEEKNEDVKVILKEILDRPEDLRANRVSRTLSRIDKVKDMCESRGGFTPQNYRKALIERNNVLEDKVIELTATKKILEKTDENSVGKIIERIAQNCSFDKDGNGVTKSVLRDTDTFDSDLEKLGKKIYKDVTKKYKKMIDNSYKSWNQLTKIGVGVLITLPITCTALNWVYPRFMELCFPKLAGVKKQSAQNAQNNPQTRAVQMTGGDK